MATLREQFIEQLKDIYDAEKQILETLPKLVEAASDEDLKTTFSDHLQQTHGHVERLERIFSDLGESSFRKLCKGMKGLIEEGKEALEGSSGATRDASLIAAAQKVEHYEIATYGTLRSWAEELELDEAAELLDQTLDEEANADEKLTSIAEGGLIESGVNEEATASR